METSVYVRSDSVRRGLGRGLYGPLFQLLEAQGYREAFAGITLPNQPSTALHEAMGFEQVAVFRRVGWKLGSWHDVGWWQRPLGGQADEAPPGPMNVDQLNPSTIAEVLCADPGTPNAGKPKTGKPKTGKPETGKLT